VLSPTYVPDGLFSQTFSGVAHDQNDGQIPRPPQFPPDPTNERLDHFRTDTRRCGSAQVTCDCGGGFTDITDRQSLVGA